jgi:hypothetical protein
MIAMPQTASMDYKGAFRYTAAWAAFNHDNITDLTRHAEEFHGKLGSLNFQYSNSDRVLHVWGIVTPGAGPLLTTRTEMKATLDKIAQQQPDETAGGVFDVRTLPWNDHGSAQLEPCLYLRWDIVDDHTPVEQMMKQLDRFSTVAFVWKRGKMLEVQRAYWKDHPQHGR